MNAHRSLTQLAHQRLAELLQPGDLAVDATAGNGHDTLFLAQRVTETGKVYAFDVQTRALDATALRLEQAGLRETVALCHSGHERMLVRIPEDWLGKVSAVTFNLGYLPGSDKQTTTGPASTLPALDQALALLRRGGMLSVMAYRGHAGGMDEADTVARWCESHAGQLACEAHESPGPVWHCCIKR